MMRWSTFAVIGLGLACLLGFVHAGELPTRPKTGDEAVVRDPPKPNVPAKPAPKAEGPAKVSAKTQTFAGIEFCWIPPGTFTMGSPVSEEGHGDTLLNLPIAQFRKRRSYHASDHKSLFIRDEFY